ncbi:hypothetical protein ALC56_07637, partial [Trachymyrmex septentrionalis]
VNPETPTILDTRFVTNPRDNDSSERVQQSMTKKRRRILSTGRQNKSSRHRSVTNEPAPSVNYPRLNPRRDSPLLRSEMKISERATDRPRAARPVRTCTTRSSSLSLLRVRQVKERKLVVRSRPGALKGAPLVHAGEQRKILVEKCALARGKYQTYLEMFEHSPREVCARIRKSGEIQILRFDYP